MTNTPAQHIAAERALVNQFISYGYAYFACPKEEWPERQTALFSPGLLPDELTPVGLSAIDRTAFTIGVTAYAYWQAKAWQEERREQLALQFPNHDWEHEHTWMLGKLKRLSDVLNIQIEQENV